MARHVRTRKEGPVKDRDVHGFTVVKLPDQIKMRNIKIPITFSVPLLPRGGFVQKWSWGPPLKLDASYRFPPSNAKDVMRNRARQGMTRQDRHVRDMEVHGFKPVKLPAHIRNAEIQKSKIARTLRSFPTPTGNSCRDVVLGPTS